MFLLCPVKQMIRPYKLNLSSQPCYGKDYIIIDKTLVFMAI